nr:hypothetical protein [Tanacetum cinerariifolium]
DTMNDDTPVGVAPAVQEGVISSVVDMMVEMEKQNSLDDTSVPESFSPLSTPVTTTLGNASAYGFFLGNKVAYPVVVNYVRNTWGKYGLVRSMFSSSTELFYIQFSSIDGLDAMLENDPWFIRNNPLILKKWHPDEKLLKEDVSIVPVWVKLHGVPVTAFNEDGLSSISTKPELKDNIVMAIPKITKEGHYTCNYRVEYEWKPPGCSSCVSVGPKMGFKPQKEDQFVPKKPTASSSGNKKKEHAIEVSNSNPFDVLNSVDNDVECGINGGLLICKDEVASVDSDMTRSIASEKVGFGTPSLLEQWKDSYGNGNYDDDLYDDDMYEGSSFAHVTGEDVGITLIPST